MDEWMDDWVRGWMDGWMGGWIDDWVGGCRNEGGLKVYLLQQVSNGGVQQAGVLHKTML